MKPTILVVMGVSGSGKSTVAELLAHLLGWRCQEGDDLHSAANVERMAGGRALTDADRAEWLRAIARFIDERRQHGEPGVVTCSALKRRYRDVLRRDNVVFVHLAVSARTLRRRLAGRRGHYMAPSLLESQIATLEPPGPDERAITVDGEQRPAEEAAQILAELYVH